VLPGCIVGRTPPKERLRISDLTYEGGADPARRQGRHATLFVPMPGIAARRRRRASGASSCSAITRARHLSSGSS